LQKKLRGFIKGSFEFLKTRNGTRDVIKDMANFSAIKSYFQKENLPFFTFHRKSLKPIKAVIRHLPSSTPAEEVYEALAELGFDVMSVKQMTSSRRALPEAGPKSTNVLLPLFLSIGMRSHKKFSH
jgi:hypothetical protein